MNEEERDKRKALDRLIMFSDAVFAIALTLLVLELKLPEGLASKDPNVVWHQLREMTPRFLAFLLSAILVGGQWFATFNLQRTTVRADAGYVIFNIIFLILISLMPFCCNLIGTDPENPVSFVVFGIVTLLRIINTMLFMRYCRTHKLYHEHADMVEIRKLERRFPIVALFVIAIAALAFYSAWLSFALYLLSNAIPIFASKSLKINYKELEIG